MSLEKDGRINENLSFSVNPMFVTLTIEVPSTHGIFTTKVQLNFKEASNLRNELSYWLTSKQTQRNLFVSPEVLNTYTIGTHTIKTSLRGDGQIQAMCSCKAKWVYPIDTSDENIMTILQAHEAYDRRAMTVTL